MASCTTCGSPLRERARFCTRCGAAVAAAPPVPEPVVAAPPEVPELVAAVPEATAPPEPATPVEEPKAHDEVPARIPVTPLSTQPQRSAAALGALAAGIAPLLISVVGNLVASEFARRALGEGAPAGGAWGPVLVAIAAVFVLTAGALTVCGILGVRALRETASGAVRGRPLAIAGLAAGAVNLVLWVAGLIVTVGSLGAVIA
ncbi:zinc ribbon domain-containing protein [Microcella frigidaquae]|uniref:Zinc-ribbon domain-containing protein n=1 Tax=Microcella frigidaquae TaxID=424758 RepID=A0A840XFD0_9MICO|nr:zinc ribbon domain-containing protein [Microcella frigidaquae]MBB5617046.1 hypothetical protein [Microcella frigidaquae]NHN45251.1 zinc ribbon domain-containing protein [Microcella frigidaquae]